MILQSLHKLYEELAARDLVEEPGWTSMRISYALNLGDDGHILDVFTLKQEQQRGKKMVMVPSPLKAPMPPKRTVGIAAGFLADNSTYLLGIDAKGKPERTRDCFEACRDLHTSLLSGLDTPAARAILAFFARWEPAQAAATPILQEYLADIVTGVNLLLYYDGRSVVEDAQIRAAWQRHYDGGEGELVRCLVSAEMARAARIHPPIKGVRGAQSSGAALVSFNAPAFCSFEREQGLNAPIGERAAFAYTTALNYLIATREHHRVLGDTTVLMWAENAESACQALGMAAFNFGDEAMLVGEEAERAVVGAMDRLARGQSVEWDGIRIDPATQYYILGLSPSAARLSVRFFLASTFGKFMQASKAHDERLRIARPSFDRFERLSAWRLLQETVNPNSRDKMPARQMTADTLRAILTDTPYPATLIQQVQLRILAERKVTRGRAAIIKAYYMRNHRLPTEVLTVELNRDATYLPYVLGRLFSVLEQVQEKANDTATIQDHYFNSAAATPAVIFPRLISLNKNHLRKLETGNRIYYEKQIQALMNMIRVTFPTRMTQAERGAFQLGYYHEQQYKYTKKEDREGQEK